MMLRHACRLSLEGLVSKRRDDRYPTGRTRSWIKSKCSDRQEFVIAGYVPSTVSKELVGSLVLGYHRDGKLVHAGRVGTGFSRAVARDLAARLEPLRRKTAPFAEKLAADAARGVDLGQARAGGRGRVPRLDRRRHPAPRRLPRPARGQAGARDRPRGAGRDGEAGAEAAAAGAPDPSRPHLLAGRRSDQAGPRRLLRRGLAARWRRTSSTARSRCCAARAAHEGQCFFQKHAWKGHEPRDPDLPRPARRRRQPARRRRWPARPDRPRAGRRARDPHLAVDARRPRASRTRSSWTSTPARA